MGRRRRGRGRALLTRAEVSERQRVEERDGEGEWERSTLLCWRERRPRSRSMLQSMADAAGILSISIDHDAGGRRWSPEGLGFCFNLLIDCVLRLPQRPPRSVKRTFDVDPTVFYLGKTKGILVVSGILILLILRILLESFSFKYQLRKIRLSGISPILNSKF